MSDIFIVVTLLDIFKYQWLYRFRCDDSLLSFIKNYIRLKQRSKCKSRRLFIEIVNNFNCFDRVCSVELFVLLYFIFFFFIIVALYKVTNIELKSTVEMFKDNENNCEDKR